MSRMLTGRDAGLVDVSTLVEQGRWQRARKLLDALLQWRPMKVSRELELRKLSAEVAHRMGHYRRARRHCRLALRLDPTAAEFHYLYGRACESDPYGCDRRAVRHFRKATQLNAQEPLSRASLGRAMVRVDEIKSGVKVLRAAADNAPTDPEVLQIVSEGLCEAGHSEVAFRILSKARFLAPASRALKHLWDQAKYDMTAQSQTKTAPLRNKVKTSVTPMLRIHDSEHTVFRRDDGHNHSTEPHISRLRAYRSDLG